MANSLGINLLNRTVIVSGHPFYCESGYGCRPDTGGKVIFGYFPELGMKQGKSVISGNDVEMLAEEENLDIDKKESARR